jgi:hypothetical protein
MGTSVPANVLEFPAFADSSFAAWCWTGSSGTYSAYEVTPDAKAYEVLAGLTIPADQAHGAPPAPP